MYNKNEIPKGELFSELKFIHTAQKNYTAQNLEKIFKDGGASVFPDVRSQEVVRAIRNSINSKEPLSVIRIGDGEGNLLSYLSHAETPFLDNMAATSIINAQQDRFIPSEARILEIKRMMRSAIFDGDIIGIRGLDSFSSPSENNENKKNKSNILSSPVTLQKVSADPRGVSGYWRSIDYIANMAKSGALNGKMITSAHLYYAILRGISILRGHVKNLVLISNRPRAIDKISNLVSPKELRVILVGVREKNSSLPSSPKFLQEVEQQLPQEMAGELCLIGAGPWSELYCSMVKKRGGVGVDFGSGFDLAEGRLTRPIHKIMTKLDFNT